MPVYAERTQVAVGVSAGLAAPNGYIVSIELAGESCDRPIA
jgi:hypothetical protein